MRRYKPQIECLHSFSIRTWHHQKWLLNNHLRYVCFCRKKPEAPLSLVTGYMAAHCGPGMHPTIPKSVQPLTLHVRSVVWLEPEVFKMLFCASSKSTLYLKDLWREPSEDISRRVKTVHSELWRVEWIYAAVADYVWQKCLTHDILRIVKE